MCGVISTMWVTSSPGVRDNGAEFRARVRAGAY
jgi:hypothetical protein